MTLLPESPQVWTANGTLELEEAPDLGHPPSAVEHGISEVVMPNVLIGWEAWAGGSAMQHAPERSRHVLFASVRGLSSKPAAAPTTPVKAEVLIGGRSTADFVGLTLRPRCAFFGPAFEHFVGACGKLGEVPPGVVQLILEDQGQSFCGWSSEKRAQ